MTKNSWCAAYTDWHKCQGRTEHPGKHTCSCDHQWADTDTDTTYPNTKE